MRLLQFTKSAPYQWCGGSGDVVNIPPSGNTLH